MKKPKILPEYTPTQGLYLAIFRELPEHDMEESDIPELISVLDGALTGRESRVIQMRFGIGCEKLTLKQTGVELGGITHERVRQIEAKALAKLRHPRRVKGIKPLFVSRAELRALVEKRDEQIAGLNEQVAELTREVAILYMESGMDESEKQAVTAIIAERGDVMMLCIDDLDLSVRLYNCLKHRNALTVSEIVRLSREDVMKIRHFGQKTLEELEGVLGRFGLSLREDE